MKGLRMGNIYFRINTWYLTSKLCKYENKKIDEYDNLYSICAKVFK